MWRTFLCLAGLAPVMSVTASAKTILVHPGTLLAVPGQPPIVDRTLVIRDGIVAGIESGFVSELGEESVTVVDFSSPAPPLRPRADTRTCTGTVPK